MNQRREEEFFARIEDGLSADLGDYRKALQRYLEVSLVREKTYLAMLFWGFCINKNGHV